MSPEEKIEMGRRLIAEAEAEIAAKGRNWPEKIELGMVFRRDYGDIYIAHTCEKGVVDNLVCISGAGSGKNWHFRKFFDGDESQFEYLGHARDLLKIGGDAHEPTGAELVGKMCEFSDDGKWWTEKAVCSTFDNYDPDAAYHALGSVKAESGYPRNWFKYARLAR